MHRGEDPDMLISIRDPPGNWYWKHTLTNYIHLNAWCIILVLLVIGFIASGLPLAGVGMSCAGPYDVD